MKIRHIEAKGHRTNKNDGQKERYCINDIELFVVVFFIQLNSSVYFIMSLSSHRKSSSSQSHSTSFSHAGRYVDVNRKINKYKLDEQGMSKKRKQNQTHKTQTTCSLAVDSLSNAFNCLEFCISSQLLKLLIKQLVMN